MPSRSGCWACAGATAAGAVRARASRAWRKFKSDLGGVWIRIVGRLGNCYGEFRYADLLGWVERDGSLLGVVARVEG